MYKRVVSDAFDSKKWKYSSKILSDEKIVFTINFNSDKYGTTSCKIYLMNNGVCDIEALLPVLCPQTHRMELSYFMAKYNYQKRYATLRLDVDNGEILNVYSFVFNQATTPKEFLNRFFVVKEIEETEMNEIIAICKKGDLVEKGDVLSMGTICVGKNGKHKLSL